MKLRTITNTARRFLGSLTMRASTILGMSATLFQALSTRTLATAASGVTVTPATAAKVAAYKRGVELIANYVGKTPFHVKEGKQKAKQHPAWKLVRRWAIHQTVSSHRFRTTLVIHCLMHGGNGYAFIKRNAMMEPESLWILDPAKVRAERRGGRLVYVIAGRQRPVPASDVFHIRGFGASEVTGDDPIKGYARDVLGLAVAQQDYASKYYEHGGTPAVYFKSDIPLDDDRFNRLTSEVGPLKGSILDPHKIPVLEQGDLNSLSLSAEQTQLLGAREFSLKDIANCLGLPVHKLQGDGKSSYKSLEEENRAFRDDSLDPWLCQFEEQYQKLLTEDEQARETHDIEAVRESLTRTNQKERAEILSKAVGGPYLTVNEARDIESLGDVEGGGELLKPLNMTPKDEGQGDDTEAARVHPLNEDLRAVTAAVYQLRALTDVYARMSKRLATQARKAATKPKSFADFLDNFEERNRGQLRAAFAPICGLIEGGDGAATADALLSDVRTELSALYDTTPAELFSQRVNEAADAFEQSAAKRAGDLLMVWRDARVA